MPRCFNDNKSVSPTNTDIKNNTVDILLSSRSYNTNNSQINIIVDQPVVEKSHRKLRCDLSPVQTNSTTKTTNYNIKFLSLKVIYNLITTINLICLFKK